MLSMIEQTVLMKLFCCYKAWVRFSTGIIIDNRMWADNNEGFIVTAKNKGTGKNKSRKCWSIFNIEPMRTDLQANPTGMYAQMRMIT